MTEHVLLVNFVAFADEKEEISSPESDKVDLIFSEMESLHKLGI